MLVVMFGSMILGIGRKDYMDKLPEEMKAEYEAAQSL